MSEETLNETQPMQTSVSSAGETMPTRVGGGNPPSEPDTNASQTPKPAPKRRFRWIGIVLLAWLLLFGVAALTGYWGYNEGIAERVDIQATDAVTKLDEQYNLALENYAKGEYELARQRLQFIIEQNPNYEKAIYLLGETLAVMGATATPTAVIPTATPTLTPTPDLRAVEEIFTSARTAMEAQEWDTAISTLLALRQKDPAFHAADVDSLLYVAFRYRGVFKILNTGQLESGLLDLSQAELFGPLDVEAQNFGNSAKLFGIGVSFWEVDWAQAAYYFGQVAPYFPNMHNGDNWYASDRFVEAMQHYIDQLVAAENFCEAQIQMQALRDFRDDSLFEPTQVWLDNQCSGNSNEGNNNDEDEEESEPEATPIPPEATPIPEATTPVVESTPVPAETPTP